MFIKFETVEKVDYHVAPLLVMTRKVVVIVSKGITL